jgi:sugar/nucleoside kinase (ribokinase family)
MQIRYEVAGLGNAIMDVLAPVDDQFLIDHAITPASMSLIDEDRALRLHAAVPDAVQLPGGSGANTIAGLASFGATTAYLGKVANDAVGDAFCAGMKTAGVHFPTPPLLNGAASARSIIFVSPDGQRSMNTFLGASTQFSDDDVIPEVIAAAQITYLEGYLFDRDEAKSAYVKAAEIARANGRKVALTLSDTFCVDRHRDSFRYLIKGHVDLVFANEAELLSLYQVDDFETALAGARSEAALIAVTRSALGSVVATATERVDSPAEPVAKVVDTTGAGDQYAAGFLFGWSRGRPLAECARLGHIAAAEVISHFGARPEVSLAELAREAGLA